MKFSTTLLLLAGASLPSAALGQVCNPENLKDGYAYIVHDQAALDAISSCETVNASIFMSVNHTGRFYLPGVRHINGSFEWRTNIEHPSLEPVPTSIELPDLESIRYYMSFHNLPSLRNVSMPKLRVGTSIYLRASEKVDLRSLEEAQSIDIRGAISRLRLEALRQVNETLHICNKEDCSRGTPTTRALNVSLPSLEEVGGLKLDGRISKLDVPQLSNITGRDRYSYSGNDFELGTSGGEPLDISMPRLAHVGGKMRMVGEIKSLSIPNVRETWWFYLDTSEELFLKVDLEQAHSIELYGNLTGIELDHLKSVKDFIVRTTIPFDCDALEESLGTALNNMTIPYFCESPEKPSSGLSKGAKIGIGVGIGGAGGILILVGTWFWLKWKKRNAPLKLKPTSDLPLNEMPPTYGEANNQEQPPGYASTAAR